MTHHAFPLQYRNCIIMLVPDGAPAALVSLVGKKQYRKCAKDIYHFLQVHISIVVLGYFFLCMSSKYPNLVRMHLNRDYNTLIVFWMQSTIFLKQLTYSVLETLLAAMFPELTALIIDIRQGTSPVVI